MPREKGPILFNKRTLRWVLGPGVKLRSHIIKLRLAYGESRMSLKTT